MTVAEMCRTAPEHRRHIDSPGDRQVGARSSQRVGRTSAAIAGRSATAVCIGTGRASTVSSNSAPVIAIMPLVVALQLGSDQRHFERGVFRSVSDEGVRETMCVGIHGSGN